VTSRKAKFTLVALRERHFTFLGKTSCKAFPCPFPADAKPFPASPEIFPAGLLHSAIRKYD
jgi:hypothetical protein